MLTLFHKVCVFNEVSAQMNLLVSLLVHKVESVLILVKELVWTTLHVDHVNLHTSRECVFKDSAVLKVAEFALYESGTLSRFNVLEPYDRTRLSIVHHIKPVLEICCCCHKNI